jgi:hypothetical protein
VYLLYIFLLSSTHLWLRCSNFFNPSKKNSFSCTANREIGNRKSQRLFSPTRTSGNILFSFMPWKFHYEGTYKVHMWNAFNKLIVKPEDTDGKIILKWIWEKYTVRVYTSINTSRQHAIAGLSELCIELSDYLKVRNFTSEWVTISVSWKNPHQATDLKQNMCTQQLSSRSKAYDMYSGDVRLESQDYPGTGFSWFSSVPAVL